MVVYNGVSTNLDEILLNQDYSISSMEEEIISRIKNKFENIYYALEGDCSDENASDEVNECVKNFVSDCVIPNLNNFDFNEEDVIDCIMTIVDDINNEDYFKDLNDQLESYTDRQYKIWEDDARDLESSYFNSQIERGFY